MSDAHSERSLWIQSLSVLSATSPCCLESMTTMPRQNSSKPARGEKVPLDTDVHVGSRVRSRRVQLGMSQSDLAEKVGITFQQIQKYEKGTNRIGSSRMSQIAGALGVQPPYFFDDPLANAGGDMEDFNTFIGSRDGVLLMQAFVKIKDKTLRRTIAQLVADLED